MHEADMSAVVPHSFLFRYSLSVKHVDRVPRRSGKRLLNLPASCSLPNLREIEDTRPIGDVRLAWNRRGLGISVVVTGRKHPPVGNIRTPEKGDGLHVWIDTRNTQSVHRASRFCHHFAIVPGEDSSAAAVERPIARAREDVKTAPSDRIPVDLHTTKTGYVLEAWLSAEVLRGFDVAESPRLGFYYHLRDTELGDQYLTVGTDFPFAHDPSLWTTLELTRD